MALTSNLEQLRAQLTEFGLNPRDWKLSPRWQSGLYSQIEVRCAEDGTCAWVGWAVDGTWVALAAECALYG